MHDKPEKTAGALLDKLVCPVTKGPLRYDAKNHQLISEQMKKAFPIRSAVPILVREEASDVINTSLASPQKSMKSEGPDVDTPNLESDHDE